MKDLRAEARHLLGRPLALEAAAMERLSSIAEADAPVIASSSEEQAVADQFRALASQALTTHAPAAESEGGGVAVISLSGLIMPKGSLFSMIFLGGGGGLARFREQVSEALADDTVGSIVLNIDSPGGLVDQVPETAAFLREANDKKPITAVCNVMCASAAYWLAAQAEEITITPSGMAGSIGVYRVHRDYSGWYSEEGVTHTFVSAGKFKVEGNPYEPLGDEAKAAWQDDIDDLYDMFVDDVAAGRGVSAQAVKDGYGEGRVLNAQRAVKAGLADRVATLGEAIAGRLGGSSTPSPGPRAQTPTSGQEADAKNDVRPRLAELFDVGFQPSLPQEIETT